MSSTLKLPPRIKILEALGCIGDNRINLINDKKAIVISSDGSKKYNVYVDIDKGIAYSDDNGTKLRRYIGYPILALLMIKGLIPYDKNLANALSGIQWKKLNEYYKNYYVVEKIVLDVLKSKGISEESVNRFIENTIEILRKITLRYTYSIPKN
ncbi:MAG: hypothetical protein QXG46_00290 [Ignisphaera sp.]